MRRLKEWKRLGVKVEAGKVGSAGKSEVPETDGEGRWENPPPIMKTPQSTKLQLWTAPSVPTAATERQQPANKHPLMNGGKKKRLDSEAGAAWPCFWCMKEAQTCSSASTNGHGEFPLWSVDWIDSEADHQWRAGKWREWISRGFSGRLLWNWGEEIDARNGKQQRGKKSEGGGGKQGGRKEAKGE